MKFLKVNINYRDMVKDFFAKYPDIHSRNYDEICSLYYGEFYWPSNFVEQELSKMYGWECESIIFTQDNNHQTSLFFDKWCESRGIKSSLDNPFDRLLFQIATCDPDVLYIHEILVIPESVLGSIRLLKPKIKIFGWNCDSTSIAKQNGQKYIDALFTCSTDMLESLVNNHFFSVVSMPHMFDASVLESLPRNAEKKYDLVFFGKLQKDWYQSRIDLLKQLINSGTKLTIFGTTDDEELDRYCKPAIYGKDIYRVISESKIVLSIHSHDCPFASNIRLFEITGAGSMLLTDYKPNMNDLFIEKEEAVTFKSDKEAVELIKYYLENDNKREQIAKAGQSRTLKDYSYKVLAKEIYKASKKDITTEDKFNHLLKIKDINNKKIEFRNSVNSIILQAKNLSDLHKNIAIYGNGNIAKLIREQIPNLVAIFDKNAQPHDREHQIYALDEIPKIEFDIVLITAIGYEKEIEKILTDHYGIEKNKIVVINI